MWDHSTSSPGWSSWSSDGEIWNYKRFIIKMKIVIQGHIYIKIVAYWMHLKPWWHTLLRWCGNGERDLGWCNNEIPLFSDKIEVLPLPLQYASALFRLLCVVPFSFRSYKVIMIYLFMFQYQKWLDVFSFENIIFHTGRLMVDDIFS